MDSNVSFEDKLAALRQGYLEHLPARCDQVRAAWEKALSGGVEHIALLHRLVHSITGSGATFGFMEVSAQARILEQRLKYLAEASAPFTPEVADELAPMLSALEQACARAGTGAVPSLAPTRGETATGKSENKLVYCVEDDPAVASSLNLNLSHFGYTVEVLDSPAALADAWRKQAPAAVVMDIMFPEGELAGPDALAAIPDDLRANVPVIFLSARDDFSARLAVVRAGGDAYLIKPVDGGELLEKLDTLTSRRSAPEAFRVLIVDDAEEQARFYGTVLEHAGMQTRVVTEAEHVLDQVAEFNPEVILLDMYLPGCRGDELAKVIRQVSLYVSIPIVYLSAETDLDRQLSAMKEGGDEFLTKSITPEQLVSAVSSRVERYRVLRSLMVRDSLTGLLKHSVFLDQLEVEVQRARRQGHPLAFAMIDIDHFKMINDRYGHPAGDQVLKRLARFLRQRLRKSDLVGRYGGEEFAIAFTDTRCEDAVRVIEKIREEFSNLDHDYHGQRFKVTFSVGIAGVRLQPAVHELVVAADEALYRAKAAGRNRVEMA